MPQIPEELLEQVERGNVLLFVGEHIVRDAQILSHRLAERLAARFAPPPAVPLSFPEVAQDYEEQHGRYALVQFVRDQLASLGDEPQPEHRLIAGLTSCKLLVTTCIDRRLERAFAEAGRPLDVVVNDLDVPFIDERKARIYCLRGSLDQVQGLILTVADLESFEDRASISVVLQGHLASKTILFIGYDLADPSFQRLYRTVITKLDRYARPAYALFADQPPSEVAKWCRRYRVNVIESEAAAFLQTLADALTARTAGTSARSKPAEEMDALHEAPYKLLDYYEASDARIFFGRQRESQALSALIHAHRLVLVYGPSGVGKTSLLLAGAVPRLAQAVPPYAAVQTRVLDDPSQVLSRVVRRLAPTATLPQGGPLVDLVAAATAALGRPIVIILDQFEEFFIRHGSQLRAAFIAELGALYHARDVPIKVVISLREDWLASIGEFETRIPEVFRNRMRVLPLTHTQARESITEPVERLGVRYEPELVDRVLDDLAGIGASVMPPQLQLVCSALYGGLEPGENQITVAAYERLGGARGVLQQYLAGELGRLEPSERALTREVLAELVTSQGTKAVKTLDDLSLALDVGIDILAPTLEKLVQARLLRPLEREDGEVAYELSHEYLIHEIGLAADTQARKQVEELIRQELENWQRFGTLLAEDKLLLIDQVRDELRLSAQAEGLLVRSAIRVGHAVEYWIGRSRDPESLIALLSEAAGSRWIESRAQAVDALGQLGGANPAVASQVLAILVERMRDLDVGVRDKATDAMRRIAAANPDAASPAIESLLGLLAGTDADIRGRAAYALGLVAAASPAAISHAIEALLNLLADTRSNLQADVTQALGWVVAAAPRVAERGSKTSFAQIAPDQAERLFEALLALLADADAHVRASAATAMERVVSATPRATSSATAKVLVQRLIQALLALLGDQDANVRASATTALGSAVYLMLQWPDVAATIPSVLEALLERRTDPDERVRASVALTLGKNAELTSHGLSGARYKLGELLADTSSRVRASTVNALDRIMDREEPTADAEKVLPLLTDASPEVRWSAAITLRHFVRDFPKAATSEATMILLDAPNDTDQDMRTKAAEALQRVVTTNLEVITPGIAESLVALLDSDLPVRDSPVFTLEAMTLKPAVLTPSVVEALIGRFDHRHQAVRFHAATLLGWIVTARPDILTSQMVDLLVARLADPHPEVRHAAAVALGWAGKLNPSVEWRAVEALVGLLSDEDASVRTNATWALRQLCTADPALARQIDQLLHARWDGTDIDQGISTVLSAAETVQLSPDLAPQLAKALVDHLAHQDERVRAHAAQALGKVIAAEQKLATSQMAETLAGLLADTDEGVRASAAQAFGQVIAAEQRLATSQMAETLVGLLADADQDVRASAAQAFGQVIKTEQKLATPQVVGTLVGLLGNAAPHVRDYSMRVIQRLLAAQPDLASPQLVEALLAYLADKNSRERDSATQVLGRVIAIEHKLVTSQALETLVGLLSDAWPSVRTSAAETLGRVIVTDPKLATSKMAEAQGFLLLHDDNGVRARAAQTLEHVLVVVPELATPEMVTILAMLLGDHLLDARDYSMRIIHRLLAARPDLASPEVVKALARSADDSERIRLGAVPYAIEELLGLLAGEDTGMYAGAVARLRQIAADNHEIINSRTIEALLGLVVDSNKDATVRAEVVEALKRVMQARPEAATPEAAEALLSLLADENYRVQRESVAALRSVAANSELTPLIVEALLHRLTNFHPYVRDAAIGVIEALVKEQPDLATSRLAAALIRWLGYPDRDTQLRAAVALRTALNANRDLVPEIAAILSERFADTSWYGQRNLQLLVIARPELATWEIAQALLGRLNIRDTDANVGAAEALGACLVARPELATSEMTRALTRTPMYMLFREAGEQLRTIYVHQATQSPEAVDVLISQLSDAPRFDHLWSLSGAESATIGALFLVSLKDRSRKELIRAGLEALAAQHSAPAQMSASLALNMLNIADLAHTAVVDPRRHSAIIQKLKHLRSQPFNSLFTRDFTWALGEALAWLEQQESPK
jgi:HEAT repeat protein